jgi:hypothetical protein
MSTPTSIPQASSSLPQLSSAVTPQAAQNEGSNYSASITYSAFTGTAVSIPSTITSLSNLTLDGTTSSQGPTSNTLATSLGADPQLESPSSMSPASYQQAISTMLDSLCQRQTPDTTEDGQTVTDSSSSTTSSEASSNTSATNENSSTSGANSTSSTTPNYVSMTEIMSEVENLAVKESGNQAAQQNAYLSETNAMVNTAIQGAQDLINSGAELLTAAIVGLVCTCVGSAAALGIGGCSMGSADAEGSDETAITEKSASGESDEDGIEMTSIKSEEVDASAVEKESDTGDDKAAEETSKDSDVKETKTTEKKAAEKKKAAPLDSMMAAQYMGMATSLGDAGGKVGSASFQAQATTDQADSQKLQALVDNYNSAASMCNSNIQMTASQVQALDTTASSVAQAEAQMVSATSRS